jgi:hypothetical protein
MISYNILTSQVFLVLIIAITCHGIHLCLNHPCCSPDIFLFHVVLTFSEMGVMFGTMDHYELRQVYMLSKTYRIAVLTFSICPLKCHITAAARALFCVNFPSGQCSPFQMKILHLMGQYCIVGSTKSLIYFLFSLFTACCVCITTNFKLPSIYCLLCYVT